MDLELSQKHVLVTGGSKGIGLACALAFLREGARVSVVSRSPEHLRAAVLELQTACPEAADQVETYSADLQDADDAQRAVGLAEARFGDIDVLVNSAGAARRTPPDELNISAWHDAMNAKFFTYINMIDPVIKKMGQRGTGAIVNVVGSGGKVAKPTHLPGGAANAALMLISAGLASAYAAKGVRVNAVNPGMTETGRLTEGLQATARLAQLSLDDVLSRTLRDIPMGRLAQPHEIANAVVFLASPRASYVTGIVLSMDGAAIPLVV